MRFVLLSVSSVAVGRFFVRALTGVLFTGLATGRRRGRVGGEEGAEHKEVEMSAAAAIKAAAAQKDMVWCKCGKVAKKPKLTDPLQLYSLGEVLSSIPH